MKVASFYDKKGLLGVDCTECERGHFGSDKDKCSAGSSKKKKGLYCFQGNIIPKYKLKLGEFKQ